jgi:hypothetical protein
MTNMMMTIVEIDAASTARPTSPKSATPTADQLTLDYNYCDYCCRSGHNTDNCHSIPRTDGTHPNIQSFSSCSFCMKSGHTEAQSFTKLRIEYRRQRTSEGMDSIHKQCTFCHAHGHATQNCRIKQGVERRRKSLSDTQTNTNTQKVTSVHSVAAAAVSTTTVPATDLHLEIITLPVASPVPTTNNHDAIQRYL